MITSTTSTWKDLFQNPEFREQFVTGAAPEYLNKKRWFGAKSSLIKKYDIEIQLQFPIQDGKIVHLLMIEATFFTANSDTYFLPVSFETGEKLPKEGQIMPLEIEGQKGWLMDALYMEDFRNHIFRLISFGVEIEVKDGFLVLERGGDFGQWDKDQEIKSRLLNAEQSNTTVVYNDKYFLKIYRKLYRDLNPDAEVSRFLTEKTDFRSTPAFCGAITWTKPGYYKVSLGMMQEKVENQGDAWSYFLEKVKDYFRRIQTKGIQPEQLERVPLYKPLRAESLPDLYNELIGAETLESVRKLAKRTAEMHLALFWDKIDLPFCPAPYTEDYKVWLLNRLMYILDHRITTMENVMDNFSPQAKEFATEFLSRRVEIKNRILNFDEQRLNSARIRIHGDYHLGQVIRSGDDWIILDFEGEPEATIRDRKVKQSPLKDVAGMCRSFHYAVFATIFTENEFKLSEAVLSEAGGRYYRAIVAVFLDTYLNTAFARGLNIGYASEIDFLLRYHIFEKAIYELGYELNSRPDWVIIPLKGLNQILNND